MAHNHAHTVADLGFLEGGFWYAVTREARAKLLEATPTFGQNHAQFRSFLRQTTSSSSPIDLFSNEFLLKHSKVSHSSSFLSSVARKGGSIYLTLVLGVAKRGVPVHPWIPLWIRHCHKRLGTWWMRGPLALALAGLIDRAL